MAAAVLGCGWLWYLFWLGAGKGLVNMEPKTMIFDLVVVGFLSFAGFALSTKFSFLTLGGWFGGQLIFLVWDGMVHGRSFMFGPTNFVEALMLGLLVVGVLNWSALVGALLGFLLRYLFRRSPVAKTPAERK